MTLNSKVLSLVLLSGLTMGGAFAKIQTSSALAANMKSKASALRANANTVGVSPAAVQAVNATCATCPNTCATCTNNCSSCPTCTPPTCTACPPNLCPPAFCPPKCPSTVTSCACTPGSACYNLCVTDCPAIPCDLQVIEPLCFKAYLTPSNVIGAPAANPESTPGLVTGLSVISPVTCATFELCFDSGLNSFAYRFTATGTNVAALTTVESYTAASNAPLTATTPAASLLFPFLAYPGKISTVAGAGVGYNVIQLSNAFISADRTCLSITGVVNHDQYLQLSGQTPGATVAISERNSLWLYAEALSRGWVQIVARGPNNVTPAAQVVVLQGTPVAAAAAVA